MYPYAQTPYPSEANQYNLGAAFMEDKLIPSRPVEPLPPQTKGTYISSTETVIPGTYESPPFNPKGAPGNTVTKTIFVQDTDTGKPLVNANVYVKGSSPRVGAVTDRNGNVTLEADPGATIVISHVGYDTKERTFGTLGGSENLDVRTEELGTASIGGDVNKKNWWIIPAALLAIWGISTIASKGNKGKTGLNGRKPKKKGKKRTNKKTGNRRKNVTV